MSTAGAGDLTIRWDQDRLRRVVEVSGALTPEAAPHLFSALLGVGTRHLVIDLNAVSSVDDICVEALVDILRRLGPGQVEVRGGAGLAPLDLASGGGVRPEGQRREWR